MASPESHCYHRRLLRAFASIDRWLVNLGAIVKTVARLLLYFRCHVRAVEVSIVISVVCLTSCPGCHLGTYLYLLSAGLAGSVAFCMTGASGNLTIRELAEGLSHFWHAICSKKKDAGGDNWGG